MRSDFLPLMSQQAYGLCHLLASKTLLALEAGGCAMLGQRCNANHCSAVLETHHISLEHTSWIISTIESPSMLALSTGHAFKASTVAFRMNGM